VPASLRAPELNATPGARHFLTTQPNPARSTKCASSLHSSVMDTLAYLLKFVNATEVHLNIASIQIVVLLQICLVVGKERDSLPCSSDHDTIGGKWRVSIDDGRMSGYMY